jgi:23S rRNA pseudouridine2604 synthase
VVGGKFRERVGYFVFLFEMIKRDYHGDSVSLNKYIADTGFCSRRDADKYIDQGRVTINDNVAIPGNRVGAGDVVEVDGEPIGKKKATIYIAYHKPKGITSTTDQRDKTNIVDAIAHTQRIFPIGRLDKDSEGLIFLTNDGNIVNKILRAGNEHEKEYVVTVDKPIDGEFVARMAGGVHILGTKTHPCKVVQEGKSTFRITLVQGLNRQIRRMCHALGFEVTKLKRVRIMNVHLGNLALGHWRYLNAEEIGGIMRLIAESSNAPVKPEGAAPGQGGRNSQKAMEAARPAKPKPATPSGKAPKQNEQQRDASYKSFRKRGRK